MILLFTDTLREESLLLCSDSLTNVKCVISEASFDTLENAIDNRFRKYLLIPGGLGGILMIPFAESMIGVSIDEIEPVEEISKLKIPVLIIGGESDSRTIPENTISLFESANSPKELWLAPGAEHHEILQKNPELFKSKILPFLKKYF